MSLLAEGICPELSLKVINQCKAAGILTVADFVSMNGEELSKKIKVSYKDVMSIRHALLKFAGYPQRGDSLYEMFIDTVYIISTGSKCVNSILKGGIYTGEVTEIHGATGSGKTQFSLSIAASLLLETESNVLHLDTNCSFVAMRIENILSSKSEDKQIVKKCLQRIKVLDVNNVYHILDILEHVTHEIIKMEDTFFKNLKLIVVDSITPLLSPCFGSKYLDGLGFMNNIAHAFKVLCSNYMISVLICNNSVQDKNQKLKASLGSNWMYIPSVSLHVNKVDRNIRKLTIVKSCRKGNDECSFIINENGIADVM